MCSGHLCSRGCRSSYLGLMMHPNPLWEHWGDSLDRGCCLACDLGYDLGGVLEAQAQGSEDRTFVCDCFSTKYQSTCEMRRYVCRRPVLCFNGNVTEGGTVALADAGIPMRLH